MHTLVQWCMHVDLEIIYDLQGESFRYTLLVEGTVYAQ